MASSAPEADAIGLKVPNLFDPQPIIRIQAQRYGGGSIRSFSIHKDFLCYYSYFFRKECALLVGDDIPKFDVECEHPQWFGTFVKWVYTQDIDLLQKCRVNLIHLWLLADDLAVPKLQNQVIEWLETRRGYAGPHHWRTLECLYDYTDTKSPLRRYVADTWNEKIQTEDASKLPPALLVDILNSRSRRINLPDAIVSADYYVEEEEVAQKFAIPRKPVSPVDLEAAVAGRPLAKIENEVDGNINDVDDAQGPKKNKQKVSAKRRKSTFI